MATPTTPRIAALDVGLSELAADVKRLNERRYLEAQLAAQAHIVDANDTAYIHCATDPDAQVPSSDWQPGGGA